MFPLSPFLRGEGRGEGQLRSPEQASAPHPNPLPALIQRREPAWRGERG